MTLGITILSIMTLNMMSNFIIILRIRTLGIASLIIISLP
jgi:hypothetical protein